MARGSVSTIFAALACVFVTLLIASNIMAVKLVDIAGFVLPASIIIFPLSYFFGDVMTEVYGYARTRPVIWLGFLCNLLVVIALYLGQIMSAPPFWTNQAAYETILGVAPRILLASFCAYIVGEFANSYVLARLKIATNGRWLWMRAIGSTIIGQGLDSAIFITLAFYGTDGPPILTLILNQWMLKTLYETVATPLTYLLVGFLKRHEGLDTYDRGTNFNPLALGG